MTGLSSDLLCITLLLVVGPYTRCVLHIIDTTHEASESGTWARLVNGPDSSLGAFEAM